jgi:hypothetical protein
MLYDDYAYFRYTLQTIQPIPYCMTHFKIKRELLPNSRSRHRYMYHEGKIDYLGQFIIQLGYKIEGKYRFPSELNKVIPPFTQPSRGSIINTNVTLRILALDFTSPQEHEAELRNILPHWTIEFI